MDNYFLTRTKTGPDGTFAEWTDVDGNHLCYTVERPKTWEHPCINPGIYIFNQYDSPTKGDVWLRDDSAANDGRSMIEVHAANWAHQLLGCIAPGKTIEMIEGTLGVSDSQNTMKMLKSTIKPTFSLTIAEEFDAD